LAVIPYVMQFRWEMKDSGYWDCGVCKGRSSVAVRREIGCAFIRGASGPTAVRGVRVKQTVCPGYAVSLPQVIETVSCHTHWERGHLSERTQGVAPTDSLLSQIEIYDSARRGAEAYFMKPEKERD